MNYIYVFLLCLFCAVNLYGQPTGVVVIDEVTGYVIPDDPLSPQEVLQPVKTNGGGKTNLQMPSERGEADIQLSNYPNPFYQHTNINYYLPYNEQISLSVYNHLGQRVAIVMNEQWQQKGWYQVSFNGEYLASGTYFYVLQTGKQQITQQFIKVN